jgi:hypothetical protein
MWRVASVQWWCMWLYLCFQYDFFLVLLKSSQWKVFFMGWYVVTLKLWYDYDDLSFFLFFSSLFSFISLVLVLDTLENSKVVVILVLNLVFILLNFYLFFFYPLLNFIFNFTIHTGLFMIGLHSFFLIYKVILISWHELLVWKTNPNGLRPFLGFVL